MVHKKQIIKELAERSEISQREARYYLNNLIETIEYYLFTEGEIKMVHKKQIIKELAEKSGISQKEAKYYLNNLIETIEYYLLKKGLDVRIDNFCTFSIKQRKETKTVHPRTGEPLIIPTTPTIVVSVSKALKRKLKNIDKQE